MHPRASHWLFNCTITMEDNLYLCTMAAGVSMFFLTIYTDQLGGKQKVIIKWLKVLQPSRTTFYSDGAPCVLVAL